MRARSFLVGLWCRNRLDAVLGCEIVELVRRSARLDQVREQHRVLDRLHRQPRQRLEVVRDHVRAVEPPLERGLPRADDDAVVFACERKTFAADRDRNTAGHFRELALAPRDLGAGHPHCLRRDGLVEDVDTAVQVAELEPAEHLAQLRAIRWQEHQLGRIAVEIEVASHRRELLGLACLLCMLRDVLAPGG